VSRSCCREMLGWLLYWLGLHVDLVVLPPTSGRRHQSGWPATVGSYLYPEADLSLRDRLDAMFAASQRGIRDRLRPQCGPRSPVGAVPRRLLGSVGRAGLR
jgi:hypothetical protein